MNLHLTSALVALMLGGSAMAAGTTADNDSVTELLNIDVRARVDWADTWRHSHIDDSASGFEGKYLMMRLDGQIVDGLTYSWRQRFNKSVFDSSFFDATDWLTINYAVSDFEFSAGKQVVGIGGWEYDRNPVDLYSTSVFWQNVACYQLGVSAAWQFTPQDNLMFQVTQSMFHTATNKNMYGYNLLWRAQHGFWRPIYSVNLTEYNPGHYINYIVLGNRFDYDKAYLELDLMNRYASHQKFFLADCSLIAEIGYNLSPAWRLHAKYTYDVNNTSSNADMYVLPGTELHMAGGGIEFFPLKRKRTSLRLHADCYGSWGRNSNAADIMQNKTTVLNLGVTWDMNLLRLKK